MLQHGPSLVLVIERFPGASVPEVTRGVEKALEAMRPGLAGVEIDTSVYRSANYVEAAFGNLRTAMLIGFLFLVLVLGLFFVDWRAVLVSVVTVPPALLAAVLVLALAGATLNMMIVAGLMMALVVVVDDAVVDVENIRRRLRQRHDEGRQRSAREVVIEAAAEMRGALVYPTLVIVASALPLLFLPGVSGAFVRPLALAYLVAILASLVVALTVTPALGVLLLSGTSTERRASPLARRLRRGYGGLLVRSLERPVWMYATAVVVVLAGLALLLPQLASRPTLPALQDRNLLVQLEGAPGASHPAMSRITAQVGSELRSVPGVRDVGAHVGRAVTSDKVVGINSGELWLSIDPNADYAATTAAVRRVIDGYPGIRHELLNYPEQRVRAVRAGTREALVVRLFGRDLSVLRAKSAEVRQLLSGIEGVVDPRVDLGAEEPTVEIEVDVPKAQRAGLKPGDIKRSAATLLQGIEAGSLFEEQKVFEVVVWSTPETRQNLSSIRDLRIDKPDGTLVRLSDVADIRIRPNPQAIRHEGAARLVDVLATVRGRDLGAVTADVERAVGQVTFPQEHHAEVLGQLAQQRSEQHRTMFLLGAALLLILLFLQTALGSWRLALLFLLAVPIALSGAVLAALLGGTTVSLVSLTGVLAVLGIAVRQGLALIIHYQGLERTEGQALDRYLVLRGSQDRLVPTVLAALATALALLPLVVLGSMSGREIVQSLAVIVLGGLVTTMVFVLFVTPALYLRFATHERSDR